MAAKRELSSTLRNLKFMQRAAAAQKVDEEKPTEDVAAASAAAAGGGVGSSAPVVRKCIVIMEGNPQPGALKGRMSFQNFNPSIDKLNEETVNIRQTQSSSPSNYRQDNANSSRMDGVSATRFRDSNVGSSDSISPSDLKRKQPEIEMETPPSHKSSNGAGRFVGGESSSQSKGRGSHVPSKREKLDWNLLRPPKAK